MPSRVERAAICGKSFAQFDRSHLAAMREFIADMNLCQTKADSRIPRVEAIESADSLDGGVLGSIRESCPQSYLWLTRSTIDTEPVAWSALEQFVSGG